MSKTHWKKLYDPDYLGAYSLDDGKGGYQDLVAVIRAVKVEKVTGADGKKESCLVMHIEGNKPMVLNATNLKTLERLFKSPHIEDWHGRTVQIGVESVKAFGDVVDALRIRKFLPKIAGAAKCTNPDCGKEITAAGKLTAAEVVAYSKKNYGTPLCANCMTMIEKAKKEAESGETADESDTE